MLREENYSLKKSWLKGLVVILKIHLLVTYVFELLNFFFNIIIEIVIYGQG